MPGRTRLALFPSPRHARPATLAAVALAAAAIPSSAEAAPINRTEAVRCTISGGTTPTTAFDGSVRFTGQTTEPLTEGTTLFVNEASATFTPDAAGRSALAAAAGTGASSLTSFDLLSTGTTEASVPFLQSRPAPVIGPFDANTSDYTFRSSFPAFRSLGAEVVGTAVTLRFNGFSVVLSGTGTFGQAKPVLACRTTQPEPPIVVGPLPVALKQSPAAPTVTGLSRRTAAPGDDLIITGTFDGAVTGATVGGVAATDVQKLSYRQVRVTVPAAAPVADDLAVRVTAAGGTSPDSADDDLEVHGAITPGTLRTEVVNDCSTPNATRPRFALTTRLTVQAPERVDPGESLTLSGKAEVVASTELLTEFRLGGVIQRFSTAVTNQTVAITGTSTPSAVLVTGEAPYPRLKFPAAGPLAFDTPATGLAPSVSGGSVTAPDGGSVTLTPGPLTVTFDGYGSDLYDGLPTHFGIDLTCTPRPGTLGTITVGDGPITTTPDTVDYGYALGGTATLKTLVKGSLPLAGSIDAKLTLATGDFTANLALQPATANLVAAGFLPVKASVAFASTAPTTGSLKAGVLTANAKVRIKLPKVSIFGLQIAGGAGCQTKQPSNIALRSTDPVFNPLDGGALAGTFAISDLTGCGALTGLVSPLTAGKGNAIAVKLTPKS